MADASEVIDVDAETDHEPSGSEGSKSITDGSKSVPKGLSAMYSQWDFKLAGFRDKSHRGAYCNPCVRNGGDPGVRGTCTASQESMLVHVKTCKWRPVAQRNQAEAMLDTMRRKPKRDASSISGSSGASTPNKNTGSLDSFVALADKPLTAAEKEKWEQQCLRASVSANMPLSSLDDPELIKTYTDIRPKVEVPSRKVMSTRILDKGAKDANASMKAAVAESDGQFHLNLGCVIAAFEYGKCLFDRCLLSRCVPIH